MSFPVRVVLIELWRRRREEERESRNTTAVHLDDAECAAADRDLIADARDAAAADWLGARDAALLTLLYAAGLRISEALALTGADRPLPGMLRVRGKGGKERVVPLIAPARSPPSAASIAISSAATA